MTLLVKPVIIDNKSHIDTEDVYISANPAILRGSGWVDFEVNSKKLDGVMDLVWGFIDDGPVIKRVQVWTENVPHTKWRLKKDCIPKDPMNPEECMESYIEYYDDYTPLTQKTIDKETVSIEGNSKWSAIPTDASLTKGNVHKFRCFIENNKDLLSKPEEYFFGIKPHGKDYSTALADRELKLLDPVLISGIGLFEATNLLTNSTFEATNLLTWSATGDQTGNWAANARAIEADETSIVKNTVHSYKLTCNDAGGAGTSASNQTIYADGTAQGKTYTLGSWFRGDAGNDQRADIQLYDGVGVSVSAQFTSDNSWRWYAVTRTCDGAASQLLVSLYIKHSSNADVDDFGYFDGVILVEASSLTPTGWVFTGAGAVAHYDFFSKIGTYSACLERNSNDCWVWADGSSYTVSADHTVGAWVWASVADRAYVRLHDGQTPTTSTAHSGGSSWEFKTVTKTFAANADKARVYLMVITGDTTAYFDDAVLIEGSSLVPTGWAVKAASGGIGHYDQYSATGNLGAALHRVTNDTYLEHTPTWYGAYRDGKATLTANVDATVASRVRLTVYDGIGSTSSSFHTGAGGYTSISVEHTMAVNATEISARLEVITGDTIAYFDDVEFSINNIGLLAVSVANKMVSAGVL